MEGRLHASSDSSAPYHRSVTLQQYPLFVGQHEQRRLLTDPLAEAQFGSRVDIDHTSLPVSPAGLPRVPKRDDCESPLTPAYEVSAPYSQSVERLLQQQTSNAVDAKPTISPALLSAVDLVSGSQDPLESLRQRQQEQLSIAQQQLTLSAARAAFLRQQHEPVLNTPPPPPLPQLNTLVRRLDDPLVAPELGLTDSAVLCYDTVTSPASCVKPKEEEEVRSVSPLRGRGRPSVNPAVDGSPRQHPCPECGKAFPNNSALVKHRLIHSDERNFVCSICQKAFKRQDHLNGHLNVHKQMKPFPCIVGQCDKSYCDARSLRRHLEHSHNVQNPVVHSSKGTVYIKCDDLEATILPNRGGVVTDSGCNGPSQDQEMSQSSSYNGLPTDSEGEQQLRPATSSETGRPVECPQCGRTFKNMPALNGHMRLHSSVPGRMDSVSKPFDDMVSKGTDGAMLGFFTSPLTSCSPSPAYHQAIYGAHSYPVSDAQVQTSHDFVSPVQSGRPSPCDAQPGPVYFSSEGRRASPHQQQGYPDLTGPVESVLSSSNDPTMISPHLASLSGLGVSASPDLAFRSVDAPGAPGMLTGPQVVEDPYCASLPATHADPRPPSVGFHFPASAYQESGVVGSSVAGESGSGEPGGSIVDVTAGSSHMEGPLDLGPELSKDVDDELIQKELLSFMRFPGPGDGIFNPFMNDDDELLFSSPAKLTERKRHMTAPSGYSHLASHLAQAGPYEYHHQQSSSSSFSGHASPKLGPGSQRVPAGGPSANDRLPGPASSSATSNGNGKKSRPASRQRRKSRGKPENLLVLLKSVGLRRSFNLPVSPPRFRKQSGGRKFSMGSAGNHRGAGRCQQRSGGGGQHRRPRPAPLLIPRASLNRFHSQLRSPRLWLGPTCEYAKSGRSTPTPYTPPPILSPLRFGSGLFCTITRALATLAGPKSAPISPRCSRGFWSRTLPPPSQGTVDSQGASAVMTAESTNEAFCSRMGQTVSPLDQTVMEETDGQPPATDTTPHINVGWQYQAVIPNLIQGDRVELAREDEKADLMYSPEVCQHLDDQEVEAYCRVACSVVTIGGGRNAEYALHLLCAVDGDLTRAYSALLSPETAGLLNICPTSYDYVDTRIWSCQEIIRFQEAIIKHDKDFQLIASVMETRSVKECVQFYYSWKKMCTDEYKRLRAVRRRRILPAMSMEPNMYELRSLGPIETIVPAAQVASPSAGMESSPRELPNPANDFVVPAKRNIDELTTWDVEKDTRSKLCVEASQCESPATDSGTTSDTIFPCRLCGKVFYKVKSRNAHMKSHSVSAGKKGSPAPLY